MLGTLADLEAVARANEAEVCLLAIRELPDETLTALERRCHSLGVPLYRFHLEIEPVTHPAESEDTP